MHAAVRPHLHYTDALDRASYNVQHVRGRLGGVSERQKGVYICKQASIPYLGNVYVQYCTHTHKQDTHRHLPTHTTLSSSRKLRDRLRVALIGAAQPITRARLCTTLQNGAAEGLLAGEWWECC